MQHHGVTLTVIDYQLYTDVVPCIIRGREVEVLRGVQRDLVFLEKQIASQLWFRIPTLADRPRPVPQRPKPQSKLLCPALHTCQSLPACMVDQRFQESNEKGGVRP